MALTGLLPEDRKDGPFESSVVVAVDAQSSSQLVRSGEGEALDGNEPVGIVRDDVDGVGAQGVENGPHLAGAEVVVSKERRERTHGVRLLPARDGVVRRQTLGVVWAEQLSDVVRAVLEHVVDAHPELTHEQVDELGVLEAAEARREEPPHIGHRPRVGQPSEGLELAPVLRMLHPLSDDLQTDAFTDLSKPVEVPRDTRRREFCVRVVDGHVEDAKVLRLVADAHDAALESRHQGPAILRNASSERSFVPFFLAA